PPKQNGRRLAPPVFVRRCFATEADRRSYFLFAALFFVVFRLAAFLRGAARFFAALRFVARFFGAARFFAALRLVAFFLAALRFFGAAFFAVLRAADFFGAALRFFAFFFGAEAGALGVIMDIMSAIIVASPV